MSVLLDFTGARWDGTTRELCIQPVNVPAALQWLVKHDQKKTYTCEIKEFRKKRSKNANNYCWVLCEELAKVLHCNKEDIYRDKIMEVGVFRDFHVPENEEKSFCTAWGMLGTGWMTERVDFSGNIVTVRAYYGSSRYNTSQMSRLLDRLIESCEEVGIDVISPKDRALLLEDWGKRNGKE